MPTKRTYLVFGFETESRLFAGSPSYGVMVDAATPEGAVEIVVERKRGAGKFRHWGVCAESNFTMMEIGAGGRIHLY